MIAAQRPLLAVEDLSKSYNGVSVLQHVRLEVYPGQVTALLGHNGAGKSTLLRILSGVERPDSGVMKFRGRPLALMSPRDAQRAGIATVYQELRLLSELTVAENLFLGVEPRRYGQVDRRRMRHEAEALLAKHGIHIGVTMKVKELPHSQRQLVEVMAALERQASVILLDEPTTALQSDQVDELIATVKRIVANTQVGAVFVGHKLDEVWRLADWITVLRDGQVVLHDAKSAVSQDRVIALISGHESAKSIPIAQPSVVSTHPHGELARTAEPLVELVHIQSPYVREATLHVMPGEVVGLYGLVGSGRTNVLRIIFGLELLLGGTMRLSGQSYQPRGPREAIRKGIAYLTEDRKIDGFIPQLSAVDNIGLTVLRRFQGPFGVLHRRALKQRVLEVVQPLSFRGNPEGPARALSGGNQQKMLLARLLMQDPRLILLDEPTKGIDIGSKMEIHQLIRRLAVEQSRAILLVSSEEDEVLSISDRIYIFRAGCGDPQPYRAADLTTSTLRHLAISEVSTG